MKEVRPPKRPLIFYYCVAMLILLLFNFLAMPWMARQQIQEVDYGTFMDMAENQDLGQVEIQEQENQIVFTNKDETAVYSTGMIPDPDLKQMLKDSGAEFSGQVIQQTDPILSFLLTWILPIVIFVALGQYLSRRMMKNMGGPNAMAFGKSNAKVYVKSSEGIKFSDVAGEDEAKDNLKEIVEYLHDPKKYQEIGATMPKGILLVGPPGTGKTMLAKAVAGEANVPFFSISGSDFVEMFVGMGASKVRDLFKQAKEKAPCIVFIDEIDAIGQKRNSGAYGGNDEREQTLNQLLTEMDGFEGNTGVIILAATNRPESLDPALTRPGRFDRRVPVELPDLQGREDILKVHAKKIKVALSTLIRLIGPPTDADDFCQLGLFQAPLLSQLKKVFCKRHNSSSALDRHKYVCYDTYYKRHNRVCQTNSGVIPYVRLHRHPAHRPGGRAVPLSGQGLLPLPPAGERRLDRAFRHPHRSAACAAGFL